MSDAVTVSAPASTANIGGGFDCLGMALGLRLKVTMRLSDTLVINGKTGETCKDNLVYRAALKVFETAGVAHKNSELSISSDIPRASGLGSSAACIVAGATAANILCGEKLSEAELIELCAALDGHPDNILPALKGGVTAGYYRDDGRIGYIRADAPSGLYIAAATPDFPLSTEKARKVLPDKYSRADCVYSLSRAVVAFGALALGNLDALCAVGDKLHQPYRIPLITGYGEVSAAMKNSGAIGSCISGAGPTVIGFFKTDTPSVSLPDGWTLRILRPDNVGSITD